MKFQLKILDKRINFSTATPMSAGYDLQAAINEPIHITKSDKAVLIPTGVAVFMNDQSVCCLILPRSGLGHKQGLVLGNSAGLVDCVPLTANIKTKNGYVPLSTLVNGEVHSVTSYNTKTSEVEESTVSKVWQVGERETLVLSFDDGTSIEVTPTQRVLTKHGWKEAIDLTFDDEIVSVK